MPVRLEARLSRACVKWARERGWMAVKTQTEFNVGFPDFVFIPPWGPPDFNQPRKIGVATCLWVEFKAEGQDLSPIQEHVQKELAKRHQRVYTVKTVTQFRELIVRSE